MAAAAPAGPPPTIASSYMSDMAEIVAPEARLLSAQEGGKSSPCGVVVLALFWFWRGRGLYGLWRFDRFQIAEKGGTLWLFTRNRTIDDNALLRRLRAFDSDLSLQTRDWRHIGVLA